MNVGNRKEGKTRRYKWKEISGLQEESDSFEGNVCRERKSINRRKYLLFDVLTKQSRFKPY